MRVEKIKLICSFCSNEFERLPCEYRKSKAKCVGEYRPTCSNRCRVEHLNKIRRRDEFVRFRQMFFRAQLKANRSQFKKRRIDFALTLADLVEQWNKQGGICPYTGYTMTLPETSHKHLKSPFMASMDRIDSSKGYVKGNVEFVCVSANFAKNSFPKEEMLKFWQNIPNHSQ
jgi:hypothetical protein